MTLTDYLAEIRMTQPEFAARMGVSQSTVSRWCSGVLPRRKYLKRLRDETNGRVTAASFDHDEATDGRIDAGSSAPQSKVA